MTIREFYNDLWVKEGLIATDDRKEEYFQRSLNCMGLCIANTIHLCLIFPGNGFDYQINCSGRT